MGFEIAGQDSRRPPVITVQNQMLAEPAGLSGRRPGFFQRCQKIIGNERIIRIASDLPTPILKRPVARPAAICAGVPIGALDLAH